MGSALQLSRLEWFALSGATGCYEESSGKFQSSDMNVMTYDDGHVNYTQEEWALLDSSQKTLYKYVMLDIYKNLTAIGNN